MGFWFVAAVFAVSAGVSYVQARKAQKMAKKQADEMAGVLANKESNIEPIPVIYGERRVGGVRVYMKTHGQTKNEYLTMAVVLAEGEINSIYDLLIDDIPITDSRFSGLFNYEYKLGSDTQTKSTVLAGSSPAGWTDNHKLSGVAYIAIRLKWDQDVFSGIPDITAVVKGKKIYDPRLDSTVSGGSGSHRSDDSSTWAWSDNPALCIRDYLTNRRHGKGLPESSIDTAGFMSAADDCDNFTVTPYSGGSSSHKIFKTNAAIDTGKELFDNVQALLLGCRGFLPFTKGKYSLKIDQSSSSQLNLTTDNIISGLSIAAPSKSEKFNRVVAKFPNPSTSWQPDSVTWPNPESGNASEAASASAFLSEDNDEILSEEIDFESTTDIYAARDLARIICLRSRAGTTVNFRANSEALDLAIGDVVQVTHPTPGWTNKKLQVQEMVINYDGTVDLTLLDYDETIYAYEIAEEEIVYPDADLPDPNDPPLAPQNVSADPQVFVNRDGIQLPQIAVTWDDPQDAFIDHYLVKWKHSGASVYKTATTKSLSFDIGGIKNGNTYNVVVQSVNTIGVSSSESYSPDAVIPSTLETDIRIYAGNENAQGSNFYVDATGRVVARDITIYRTDGSILLSSSEGFTDEALTQISTVTGTPVTTLSNSLLDDADVETIILVAETDLTIKAKLNSAFFGSSTVSGADALADIPENFTVKILYKEQSAGSYTQLASQTYTRTTGTPTATQYQADTNVFEFGSEVNAYAFITRSVGSVTADGFTILTATLNDLSGAGSGTTYLFKTEVSTTDTSYNASDNHVDSNADRIISITSGGTGFYVENGTGSQGVPEGDITAVTAGTNLTGGGTSGDVTLNLNSTISGNHTFSNNLTVSGDLTVNGTTTTLNTANLDVEDKNITINYGAGDTSASANGAGITIQDAVNSTTDATILWDATNDEFDFSHAVAIPSLSLSGALTTTSTIDGRDIAADGSKLDGIDSGAEVNVQADWNATSGDAFILNKPNIPADAMPISGGTFTGNVDFNDGVRARFGASDDLQIYHSGTQSYIQDTGTGSLSIETNGTHINLKGGAGNNDMAKFQSGGGVQLFHSGSEKLEVTSTGIDVTGTATMDGLVVSGTNGNSITQTHTDGNVVNFAQTGTGGTIDWRNANGGALIRTGDASRLLVGSNGDISFYEDTGTTAKFFWDASAESLGIGTSSPEGELHILGSASGNGDVYVERTLGAKIHTQAQSATGIFGTVSNHDLAFKTNDTQRMRIDSAGNVGIGTSSPDHKLHIETTNNSALRLTRTGVRSFSQYIDNVGKFIIRDLSGTPADRLAIDSAGNVGIGGAPAAVTHGPHLDLVGNRGTLTVGTGYFEDNGTTNFIGGARSLAFGSVGSGERMRIDSAGVLLVGKTGSGSNIVGFQAGQDGFVAATRASAQPLVLNRTTTDGIIADFRKDGATVGSIGVASNDLNINGGANHSGIRFQATGLYPLENGTPSSGEIDLGATGSKFKDLYLSGSARASSFVDSENTANYLDSPTSSVFRLNGSTAVNLTVGGSNKLQADASGIDVTGVVTASGTSATTLQLTRTSGTNVNVKYSSAAGTSYIGQGATSGSIKVGTTADLIGAGNEIWHAGNDGSGSGLDADTVDGLHGSSFLRSDADDIVNGSLAFSNGNSSYVAGSGGGRVSLPAGASYFTTSNSHTGAVKIKLPTASKGKSDMLSFEVTIFDYALDESVKLLINAYQYSDVNWHNQSVVTLASQTGKDYTVRFGSDATSHCLWIGETTTAWSYPQVSVSNFMCGFSANASHYVDGWDVSFVTAFDTVQDTVTSSLPMAQYAQNAALLDGRQPPTNWAETSQTYTTIASGEWDLPTGSSVFSKSNSSGGPSDDGYWFVTGRRDTGGGYSGIYTPHNDGNFYVGYSSTGTANPNWYKVWTEGNDGSGSGLDADLLDGQHGSYYYSSANLPLKIEAGGAGPSTENLNTIANSVSTGQLEYRGFNSSSSNAPPVNDNANGVITVGQHSGNYNAQLAFSSNGSMYFRDNPSSSFGSWRKVYDAGNDGSGSGLDADLLDGQQGSAYLRSNVSATNSVDLRAPIFYDSNNTAFYLDPASTSKINEIWTTAAGSNTTSPRWDTSFYVMQSQHWYNHSSSGVMLLGESGNAVRLRGSLRVGSDGNADSGMVFTAAGSANATSSFRAPIFYDSDNTGYYVNPLNTSVMNVVTIGGSGGGFIARNVGSQMGSLWLAAASSGTGGANTVSLAGGATTYMNANSTGIDVLGSIEINGTTVINSSRNLTNVNSLSFSDTSPTLLENNNYLRIQTASGVTDIGSGNSSWSHFFTDRGGFYFGTKVHVNGEIRVYNTSSVLTSTGAYAPAFYDSDNTAFYVDPANTSTVKGFVFNSGTTLTQSTPNIESLASNNTAGNTHYHATFCRNNGTVNGKITTNYYATTYSTTSDYRVKEDIQPMGSATADLMALNPVNFQWVGSDMRADGFLAHEVSGIVPDAVVGDKDAVDTKGNPDLQGLDQSKMVPLLVKTIQEQQAVIESLEARLIALENA